MFNSKAFYLILAIAIFFGSKLLYSYDITYSINKVPRFAVLPLENSNTLSKKYGLGKVIREMLITEIKLCSNSIKLIDSEYLENEKSSSYIVDYIISGAVAYLSEGEFEEDKYTSIEIDLRVLDSETGVVIYTLSNRTKIKKSKNKYINVRRKKTAEENEEDESEMDEDDDDNDFSETPQLRRSIRNLSLNLVFKLLHSSLGGIRITYDPGVQLFIKPLVKGKNYKSIKRFININRLYKKYYKYREIGFKKVSVHFPVIYGKYRIKAMCEGYNNKYYNLDVSAKTLYEKTITRKIMKPRLFTLCLRNVEYNPAYRFTLIREERNLDFTEYEEDEDEYDEEIKDEFALEGEIKFRLINESSVDKDYQIKRTLKTASLVYADDEKFKDEEGPRKIKSYYQNGVLNYSSSIENKPIKVYYTSSRKSLYIRNLPSGKYRLSISKIENHMFRRKITLWNYNKRYRITLNNRLKKNKVNIRLPNDNTRDNKTLIFYKYPPALPVVFTMYNYRTEKYYFHNVHLPSNIETIVVKGLSSGLYKYIFSTKSWEDNQWFLDEKLTETILIRQYEREKIHFVRLEESKDEDRAKEKDSVILIEEEKSIEDRDMEIDEDVIP